MMKVTVAPTQI